mmetsp:Transcript_29059/g.57050  ORF Transcript_29059/g.57050 Transcript_29059/m.57050 type:complete len:211 (-) Transcript_29059:392-1024(-)
MGQTRGKGKFSGAISFEGIHDQIDDIFRCRYETVVISSLWGCQGDIRKVKEDHPRSSSLMKNWETNCLCFLVCRLVDRGVLTGVGQEVDGSGHASARQRANPVDPDVGEGRCATTKESVDQDQAGAYSGVYGATRNLADGGGADKQGAANRETKELVVNIAIRTRDLRSLGSSNIQDDRDKGKRKDDLCSNARANGRWGKNDGLGSGFIP